MSSDRGLDGDGPSNEPASLSAGNHGAQLFCRWAPLGRRDMGRHNPGSSPCMVGAATIMTLTKFSPISTLWRWTYPATAWPMSPHKPGRLASTPTGSYRSSTSSGVLRLSSSATASGPGWQCASPARWMTGLATAAGSGRLSLPELQWPRHRDKHVPGRRSRTAAGRALHRAGLVSDPRMERLRQDHGSDDYRHASPVMRGVLVKAVGETERSAYVPPLQDWASAGRPVELVWWEHDTQASLAGVLPALDGLASVKVTVVPGAGHLVNRQLASELRAALVRHRPAPLSRDPV